MNDINSSTDSPQSIRTRPSSTNSEIGTNLRICWVCYATEEDDLSAAWVRPCRCSGSTKWVHRGCLHRWIDVKQAGNTFKVVSCPQCQHRYLIIYPKANAVVAVLQVFDQLLGPVSMMFTIGTAIGTLFYASFGYGFWVAALTLGGYDEAIEFFCNYELAQLPLPAILPTLLVTHSIDWMAPVSNLIDRLFPLKATEDSWDVAPPGSSSSASSPPAQAVANQENQAGGAEGDGAGVNQNPDGQHVMVIGQKQVTRVIFNAVTFPPFSVALGHSIFRNYAQLASWKKALYGSAIFLLAKGLMSLIHNRHISRRRFYRKVKDFAERNYGTQTDFLHEESNSETPDEDDEELEDEEEIQGGDGANVNAGIELVIQYGHHEDGE